VEVALSDLKVVEVGADDAGLPALVDQKDHSEHLSLELFVANSLSRDCERVAEKQLWSLGALNGLLDGIDSARGHGDSDDMFEIALAVALFKFLVDNVFHPAVDLHTQIVVVLLSNSLTDVEVDTFVDESFGVQVVTGNIKAVSSFECKP
jgi:hypothetical protein